MLILLDNLLRHLFMDGLEGLKDVATPAGPKVPVQEQQIGVAPPNDAWVQFVSSTRLNALNVYLIEVRENRRLRSNERERGVTGGVSYSNPAPARLDCHYLISAWSPTEDITVQVEPTLDEHQLLYDAAALLIRAAELNPSRIYPPGSAALGAWGRFGDVSLPIVVGPPEGFPKLAEFWGTMGSKQPWKPALHLVVTLPIELLRETAGPMVTTRITEYRPSGATGTPDVWIQIAGSVIDARTDPHAEAPVAGAWVQLETTGGQVLQRARTNELGRFTFVNVRPGSYSLTARAAGLGDLNPPRPIDVPSSSGEYDLRFV
jgi:Pvc16 N-terminal domain/Carboxypeptidase regulatory-like domain